MDRKDVVSVLRHIDANQKKQMVGFFLELINNFKSEMSFPQGYSESDVGEVHHENLKLIDKILIKSGILKGMVDQHNFETPVFKTIGQKLFAIRNNSQTFNQIIGAYNADGRGNSNYDPEQPLDLIFILGKKAFYANKLAKFAGYYFERILTKNNCGSNEIWKDSILDAIPPDDVFFDYINGKVSAPNARKDLEDKIKSDIIGGIKRRNRTIFTSNTDLESNILNISSQDLMRILTLRYAESVLYTTKSMSIDKMFEEIEKFNEMQREEGLGEIEYGCNYDDSVGRYAYVIDLPYMNIPLMVHTTEENYRRNIGNNGVRMLDTRYISNMLLMSERDAIFDKNFERNLEEVSMSGEATSFIAQLSKRKEEDRNI